MSSETVHDLWMSLPLSNSNMGELKNDDNRASTSAKKTSAPMADDDSSEISLSSKSRKLSGEYIPKKGTEKINSRVLASSSSQSYASPVDEGTLPSTSKFSDPDKIKSMPASKSSPINALPVNEGSPPSTSKFSGPDKIKSMPASTSSPIDAFPVDEGSPPSISKFSNSDKIKSMPATTSKSKKMDGDYVPQKTKSIIKKAVNGPCSQLVCSNRVQVMIAPCTY